MLLILLIVLGLSLTNKISLLKYQLVIKLMQLLFLLLTIVAMILCIILFMEPGMIEQPAYFTVSMLVIVFVFLLVNVLLLGKLRKRKNNG